MRRKSLWKNLMFATALTVVLGTAPVTAFAADVDSTVPEQTTPEATVPEADIVPETEVSVKATAPTINATASSTTFDGTKDVVVTFTITSEGAFEVGGDIPLLGGETCNATYEKVSDTEHRFTIPAQALKNRVEGGAMKDGQTLVFHTGYEVSVGEWGTDSYQYVDFPDVTLTYDSGAGDNGNGETPEKPENPDPDNGNGDNNGGDNNNGQTPENPDNGNGDNNGGQTPETPDNGNGQTPETPDNGNSNTNNQNNTQNNTNNNQTTAKPTKTSPKTGDATATLPVAGTGLASLGVALATVLRKRK